MLFTAMIIDRMSESHRHLARSAPQHILTAKPGVRPFHISQIYNWSRAAAVAVSKIRTLHSQQVRVLK